VNPERIPPPTPLGQIPMYQGGSHTTRCHHNPPGHTLRIPPCTVRRRCAHARLHLRRSHAPKLTHRDTTLGPTTSRAMQSWHGMGGAVQSSLDICLCTCRGRCIPCLLALVLPLHHRGQSAKRVAMTISVNAHEGSCISIDNLIDETSPLRASLLVSTYCMR
jgi:hypothetical protein